jgi:hypothetical protein
MDLKDLKNTWDKLGAGNQLDEKQLKEMLGKRTRNVIERIDRNIKIGFGVLLALILIFALDDLILSPRLLSGVGEDIAMPDWLLFLGVFSNALIITTFVYFVIKYYRVRKSCDTVCDLKVTLVKIIDTLKIYQRLFYLALAAITITMAIGFITGLYQGSMAGYESQGISFSEIRIDQLLLTVLIGIVVLAITVGGIFILFRWGFRKLYGNYIHQLKLTLNELTEIEE